MVRVASYHDAIAYSVLVRNAVCIFAPIILKDALLLAFLDALPVGLEGDIEDSIAIWSI